MGAPQAEVVLASLPPYFAFGPAPSVPVPPPAGFELALGVTLPIGTNRPNVYMAFGDSITQGDGSRSRRGYRDVLAGLLAARFGRARIENEGVSGTDSERGLGRLPESLARAAAGLRPHPLRHQRLERVRLPRGLRHRGEPAPHGPDLSGGAQSARGGDPHPRQPRLRGSAGFGAQRLDRRPRTPRCARWPPPRALPWPTCTPPSCARTRPSSHSSPTTCTRTTADTRSWPRSFFARLTAARQR